jgi:pimeloyl-ACP methyl ester carboxylesterase
MIRIKSIILFFALGYLCFSASAQSPAQVVVQGSGVPLVMLQGGSYPLTIFDWHAKELSARYKVIRIERLNVYNTLTHQPIPADYSVNMESERVNHVLDSLKIDGPVIMVGHSVGAVIALDFALNHPNRIRSLILVEPPAFWLAQQKGEHPAGMDEVIAITKEFGPNAVITEQQLEKFVCVVGNCANGVSPKQDPQWNNRVKNRQLLRGLSVIPEHTDSIKRLNSFHVPVLICTGSKTAAYHKRIDELLQAELPVSTPLTLEGGHGACVTTAAEAFVDAVKEFIIPKR